MTKPSFWLALISAALWFSSTLVSIPGYVWDADPKPAHRKISILNGVAALLMAFSTLLQAYVL